MTIRARAEIMRRSGRLARRLQIWLLVLIGCDLGLLAARAASYQAFFSMPGAPTYLIEPVAALAIYAAVVVALPFVVGRIAVAPTAVRVGTIGGLVGGTIEVASTAVESLWTLPQYVVSAVTGVAMLGLFLSFGIAGFVGGRRTRSFWLGLGSAIWSAMLAILLVVTFGFLIVNTSLPQLARDEIGDPDYLRSGWTDVRAFAIANTYDAGFTHLVEAPLIAAVLGAAGSGMGQIGRPKARRESEPEGATMGVEGQ
jgi:hypothetical protein